MLLSKESASGSTCDSGHSEMITRAPGQNSDSSSFGTHGTTGTPAAKLPYLPVKCAASRLFSLQMYSWISQPGANCADSITFHGRE